MANSGPSLRPASEASGAARAKHSTGIPVRNPNSTGVNPRSSSICATTGATATNGPRMFSAMSPIASMRSQPRGARAGLLMRVRPMPGGRAEIWFHQSHCYHGPLPHLPVTS